MDRLALLQFLLLAFALPAQYFIVEYWSYNSTERSDALKSIVDGFSTLGSSYFSIEAWKNWYITFFIDVPPYYENGVKKGSKISGTTSDTESVALEVLYYRKKLEHFGESTKIRKVHDTNVKFRVGQVVQHNRYGLHGVIIGWDSKASANEEWINRNYNIEEKEMFLNQPHYLILVDSKYSDKFQVKSYVAQSEIELLINTPVNNKLVKAYFEFFDGGQYVTKKFLKTVYPQD